MAESTIMKTLNGRRVYDEDARKALENIKNAAPGLAFDTVADMEAYIAENAGTLKVGQDLFIRAADVPDYWWDGTTAVPVETELGEVKEQITELTEAIAELDFGVIVDGTYTEQPSVISIAHRGYSTTAPENTLQAYQLAKTKGFDYAECDVNFTSDNMAVLLHDDTIDRTSDGSGNISTMTFDTVRQYDFGSWKSADYAGAKIPTFKEFMKLCKYIGLHPYIELKSAGTYTQEQICSLVNVVKSFGMLRNVTWASNYYDYLTYVVDADPSARIVVFTNSITESTIDTAKSMRTGRNSVIISAYYANISDVSVSLCNDAGIPLEIWTVNSESAILAMDSYISGVLSDSLNAKELLSEHYLTYEGESDKTLESISASYSGGDVVIGTAVSALTGIIVTATYSDGSTSVVSGYALSGTIAEGSNTITVSYGGMTTTFTVTGIADPGVDEEFPYVRELSVSDLMIGYGRTKAYPYYTARASRAGYYLDGIPAEPGQIYKFEFDPAMSTTQIAVQFWSEAAFIGRYYKQDNVEYTVCGWDSGWLSNGYTVECPATVEDGKAPTHMTFTFRVGVNETDTVPENFISYVKISSDKKILTGISATYSGGDVTVGTALENLTGITATATYSDGSTEFVTGYRLYGVISAINNTVTMRYGGATTTFAVTGIVETDGEWATVRTLTADDLMFGYGQHNSPPYYNVNVQRAGYWFDDIPAEEGYTYRVTFESTVSTAQVALQFYSTQAKSLREQEAGDVGFKTYGWDSGWQSNGYTVDCPDMADGYPAAFVLVNFRMDINNTAVTDGFITSVKLERKSTL